MTTIQEVSHRLVRCLAASMNCIVFGPATGESKWY